MEPVPPVEMVIQVPSVFNHVVLAVQEANATKTQHASPAKMVTAGLNALNPAVLVVLEINAMQMAHVNPAKMGTQVKSVT